MSCSSESYPAQQPTSAQSAEDAPATMDVQVNPAMTQQNFPWSSPDPFGGVRTTATAPAASRRRASSRPSSRSPTEGTGFKFITTTQPDEFRDPELMRTVRSHVMFGVVEGRQKRAVSTTPKTRKSPVHPGTTTRGESSSSAAASAAGKRPMPRRADSASSSNPNNPQVISKEEALDIFQRYRYPRQSSSLPASTPQSEGTEAGSPESYRQNYPKRTKRSAPLLASPTEEQSEQVLVQPPAGGKQSMNPLFNEAYQILGPFEAFIPAPSNPFSSHDPFMALPQPNSADVNMPVLKYYCHLYFGTRAMARAWLPQMIQSRESFLSTLAITTSHQDAMDGRQEPSDLTLTVQTEVFHLLNEAFNERWTRIKDSTIMSVTQLLASELVNSGPERLQFHEDGLRRLIVERGGLDRLGVQGELAAVATAMCTTSAIFRESSPDRLFMDFANTIRTPIYNEKQAVPESPLFCPRRRFFTLERSRRCNPTTLEMIRRLSELTEMASNTPESPTWDMEQQRRSVLDYLQSLPPAEQIPEGATEIEQKARWRYEACRLAGILYASSIVGRTPLSTQSYEANSTSSTPPPDTDATPSLAALVEAIKRSDCPHSECWGDMTGVLYWITLVGGTAAREQSQRRWLVALNIRAAIVLAFEHRNAVLLSLRKMHRCLQKRQ